MLVSAYADANPKITVFAETLIHGNCIIGTDLVRINEYIIKSDKDWKIHHTGT
jgi:hypothetical protein